MGTVNIILWFELSFEIPLSRGYQISIEIGPAIYAVKKKEE